MNQLDQSNSQLQDQTNIINLEHSIYTEPLKSVKVFIPAEEYDSKLSFEQNLAENKIKLFSELSANDFNSSSDPVQQCMTSSKMHQDLIDFTSNNFSNTPNSSNVTSQSTSDFDQIAFPSSNLDQNQEIKEEQWNTSQSSNSSQHSDDSQNSSIHSCDVCHSCFELRRDLALHYLTHSEDEKKGRIAKCKKRPAQKFLDRCEKCNYVLKRCKCLKKQKSIFVVTPDTLSIPQPEKPNNVFVKIETLSGKNSLFKREYFHCPECPQIFGLEMQLKQHVLTHKRKKARVEKEQSTFSCVRCYEIFDNNENLQNHMSTAHPIPPGWGRKYKSEYSTRKQTYS